MNQDEYLGQLGDALKMLSPEEITDIQSYYANSIRGEVLNGVSEERAVEHLGPADQVAQRILRTRAGQPADGPAMAAPRRKHRRTGLVIGGIVVACGILITGTGQAISSLFGSAIGPMGTQSFTADTGTVQTISIDAGQDAVTFETSPDDDIHLNWKNRNSVGHTAAQNGTELTLTTQHGKGTNVGFAFGGDDNEVCIQLPEGYMADSLQVQTSSGEIDADSLMVNTDLSLQSTSGDIDAYDIAAKGNVTVGSSSGGIYLQAINSAGLTAKSTSGMLYFSDCTTSGKLELESTSGSIDWQDGTVLGEVKLFSTSGSIDVENTTVKDAITVGTTSGSVQLELTNPASDYTIAASSVSGDIDVPNTQGKLPIEIETVSGSIEVSMGN